MTSEVSSSFTEVVDVLLTAPVDTNSYEEVNVALAALAMLPVNVRRLSLACKVVLLTKVLANYVRQN